LDRLGSEAQELAETRSWVLPPHAPAVEQVLRTARSFRDGSAGQEIQEKLSGDDEEITRLTQRVDTALWYLEALRLAALGRCGTAAEILRSMSDAPAPFGEAARALLENNACSPTAESP
jgi:hypothetical protein